MDDETAIEGLTRLGLTTYEARVFLGLQKLGSGTAAEVNEITDVPRSQVYGAADGLQERGLVEIQQSTPTIYRPVSPSQARSHLLEQIERTGEETFDYLDTVRETSHGAAEQSEAIWLVNGSEAVAGRVAELLEVADSQVIYAAPEPAQLEDQVQNSLRAAADRDVAVLLASANPTVRDQVPAASPVQTTAVTDGREPDLGIGRLLLLDDATLLLSVFSAATPGEETEEVAFWSADSAFAAVLVDVIEEWFLGEAASV